MLGPGLSPGIHDSLSPLLSCLTLPTSRNKLKNCHYQFTWSRIDLSDGSLKFSYFKTTLNSKPLDSNKKNSLSWYHSLSWYQQSGTDIWSTLIWLSIMVKNLICCLIYCISITIKKLRKPHLNIEKWSESTCLCFELLIHTKLNKAIGLITID